MQKKFIAPLDMMKTLILSVSLCILLIGCANDDLINDQIKSFSKEAAYSTKLSATKAVEVAMKMVGDIEGNITRSRSRQVKTIQPIGTQAATRSEATDTMLYLINFEDNQGFVLLSVLMAKLTHVFIVIIDSLMVLMVNMNIGRTMNMSMTQTQV